MSTAVWSWAFDISPVSSQLSSLTYIFSLTTADLWNYNFCYTCKYIWPSLIAQLVKYLPAMQETWVLSLDWEDPLEKEMATHSSTLAWKIPWMEEPGRLQSMGSQRVRHNWATEHTPHPRIFPKMGISAWVFSVSSSDCLVVVSTSNSLVLFSAHLPGGIYRDASGGGWG